MPAHKLPEGKVKDWTIHVRFPIGSKELLVKAIATYHYPALSLDKPAMSDYIRALVRNDINTRREELGL
jgi:hypothetical protein